MNNPASEALEFVRAVYMDRKRIYIRESSWRKLNAWMQDALKLAIVAGMDFDQEDVTKLYKDFAGQYWLGSPDEYWYTLAIQAKNMGFIKAYESHYKRKPFMLNGLRIASGRLFDWQGERVTCTSFAPNQSYFVACAYEKKQHEGGLLLHEDWQKYGVSDKPKRIFRISLEQLKAYDKAIRDAKKEAA